MLAATAVCFLGSVVSTVALRTPADANLNGRAAASLEEFKSAVEQMRDTMHTMGREEQDRRLAEVRAFGRNLAPRATQDKIKHFVVLFMENRAIDHTMGCMLGDNPEFDGIPSTGMSIPVDPADPAKGVVNVTCGTAPYVCKGGGGFSLSDGHFAPGANSQAAPYGPQNNSFDYSHGAKGGAIEMFSAAQLPIKKAVSENFAVFNKYYTSTPTASTPNHLYSQSATSCGLTANELYNKCGGPTPNFPQMTIYDNLYLNNVSFNIYYNSTCGDTNGTACEKTWSGGSVYVDTPDMAMMGVARHTDHFQGHDVFYRQAAKGSLPQFSFINPPGEACDHPCHDMAKGERLLKDVYEGLRNGPGWNNTMLLVMYDDAGGLYDHIIPPFEGVPNDESPCNVPKDPNGNVGCAGFDFERLGLRSTAMLISPWVNKSSIIQEPKGPTKTSQWEHSTVSATLKNLYGLTSFLTKRDAWAGSLTELLMDKPRNDAPLHFPTPPKVAAPWKTGPGGKPLPPSDDKFGDHAPRHCSTKPLPFTSVCSGSNDISTKQKNKMKMYEGLLGIKQPDHSQMTPADVDAWLADRWNDHFASFHEISTTALFNLSTSDCALTRYSHFTTQMHVEPEDEQIFLGGLPCSGEHCHMHNPDEMIPICHKVGGCCLSAASWDAERHVSTVAAAACNATDVAQRWSAIGGQVCLKHFRQCLHYDGHGSVVLTPFAEDGTHPEQQWHVSASNIEYRGAADVCLVAEAH